MTKTDLSTEALLVRREIAEKATPGPWGVKCERHDNTCHEYLILTEDGDKIVGADKIDLREAYYRSLPEAICSLDSHDAAHIAANSPDVVIATIDELLRLRAELEQYKDSIQSLRYVANKTLVDCNFRIKENISLKEEVLRIQAENALMQSMIAALARKVASLTRRWAKAGNVDNSAEYWTSWARHDAEAAYIATEDHHDQLP